MTIFWAVMFSLYGQTQPEGVNIAPTAYIKSYVDQKMGEWLQKDQYESAKDYEIRTSEKNKITRYNQLEKEAAAKYIELFVKDANWHSLQIINYDGNKQAFLIKSAVCADFMMPVPRASAGEFEAGFSTFGIINPEFYLDGNVVKFSKLTFIDSRGTKYTYNITINTPALAVTTWQFPLLLRVDTYKNYLNIKACVKSESQITNVAVLVNGQSARGISAVANDGCDLAVNQNVTLAKGMNEVKIVVDNEAGQSVSDVCYVNYATHAPEVLVNSNKRLALVIGNSAYSFSPLANPVNDATDIAAKLKKLGFDVTLLTNRTKEQMERAIDKFGSDAKEYDVALFFYAGHAVQYNGKNYLMPVNMPMLGIDDERKIEFDCTPMDRVLANMEYSKCKLKLIILDACRDNFTRSLTDSGLSPMNAPRGTFIAYSTSPGSKALDGTGRNSPYMTELLKRIATKQLKIEELFKQVREGVLERTNGQQLPWDQSSIIGDFSFGN
ncbi:MAG: caspase domain-containing protein [Candidatus Azobacteroides sp.]|nr:caspase domain-containing protein [Candidatus Azobacteroides sp.]